MECIYSHDIKSIIPVNFGENLHFIDYEGKESISGVAERQDVGEVKGLRRARLEINSFVGSAFCDGAVHYYSTIYVYSIRCWQRKGSKKKYFLSGYADKGKPKEMLGFILNITRPTNYKDIKHFKETTTYDKTEWKYIIPKIGMHERGFWTEEEAKNAAISFFEKNFEKGWVLESEEGNKFYFAKG